MDIREIYYELKPTLGFTNNNNCIEDSKFLIKCLINAPTSDVYFNSLSNHVYVVSNAGYEALELTNKYISDCRKFNHKYSRSDYNYWD